MKQITPYINFAGNCSEAMQFYHECLGGKLEMQTIAESPMAGQMPANMGQLILHSFLGKDGWSIMASDMNANNVQQGNAVHLCITCDTEEELHHSFAKLSEGGTVNHKVEKFFAGTMGNLTDKFGVHWMLYYGGDMQQ